MTVGANVNISRQQGYQGECVVALDPTNPNNLAAFANTGNGIGLMRSISRNGGLTWVANNVATGADIPAACCDPTCAFDNFGNLFLGYLDFNGQRVIMAVSTNGGTTFSVVGSFTSPSGGGVDYCTLAVGRGQNIGQQSVWVTYEAGGRIMATGAPVNGLGQVGAFITPQAAPNSSGGNFGGIAVGPGGQVLVGYQIPSGGQGPADLFVHLDPDGFGPQGFGPAIQVTSSNVGGFDFIPATPLRSIDAHLRLEWDRSGGPFSGRVYLSYTDETVNENNDTDVRLRWSDDNGTTWSAPVRVNDDTTATSQFWPRIAVDQTSGNIAISFYDARNNPGNTNVEFFAAVSVNGGTNFTNVKVSQGVSNSLLVGDPSDFGDYTGIAFHGGVFYPVWTDNSNVTGDNPNGTSDFDIYTAQVTVVTQTGDGLLEVVVLPPTGSTLLGGTNFNMFVTVTDASAVTDATVFLSAVDAAANLVFTNRFVPNNGLPPDGIAGDNVYSFSVSNLVTGTYTMFVNSSAPGKQPDQTIVTYSILSPPPNDAFANGIKIAPLGQVVTGYTHFATLEGLEPVHAGVAGVTNSVWWTFAPTNSGRVLVDPVNSTIDTVIGVYTGLTVDTLTLVAATNDVLAINAPTNNPRGWLYFDATAGETYHIAVAGVPPFASGNVSLRVLFDGAPDTNAPSVSITSPAVGLITTNGTVIVAGTTSDSGVFASGMQTVEVSLNGLPPNPALSSNNFATWSQRVPLTPGTNTLRVVAVDNAGNRSLPRSLDVTYRVFDPPNDLFLMAIDLTGNNGFIGMLNTKATKEVGEPNHAGNFGGRSIWYRFTPPSDGFLSLSTTNSDFDTVLAVYVGPRVNELTNLVSNDDFSPTLRHSVVGLAVRAGTPYSIAVDGLGGTFGTAYLTHLFTPTPVYDVNLTVTGNGFLSVPSGAYTNGTLLLLTATPALNNDFVSWQGALNTLDNPILVNVLSNTTLTATFLPKIFSDDFESGALTNLAWTVAGNVGWSVAVTNSSETNTAAGGRVFARSGVIGNSQSSSLRLTAAMIAGTGQFAYRASTEAGFDFFTFSLNGVVLTNVSGDTGWHVFAFNVPAGTNTLEWKFTKDAAVSGGLDAVFIDNVELPIALVKDFTVPVTLTNVFLSAAGPAGGPAGGAVPQFRVRGQTNQIYYIQASADLFNWTTVATNIARHGLIQFTDTQATNFPTRYYRVIAP